MKSRSLRRCLRLLVWMLEPEVAGHVVRLEHDLAAEVAGHRGQLAQIVGVNPLAFLPRHHVLVIAVSKILCVFRWLFFDLGQ